MTRSPNRALILAAGAFTVSLFLFGSALVRALGVSAADPLEQRPATEAPPPPRTAGESLDMNALMLAVDNDPFQPDRTRPVERYRMPGDPEPEEPAPPPPPPPPVPDFRLVGTVVFGPDNGTAAIAVGDADPRMLSVGDNVMGYRITAITPQTATVSNGEREIMLRVPAPSSAVAATTARGGNGRAGAANNGRGNAQGARTPQQQAQLQQLIQRAAQGGATPQMLQQIERLMANGNAGVLDAMRLMESVGRDGGVTYEVSDAPANGRVQVRPAPRRDSTVVRRPGGGER